MCRQFNSKDTIKHWFSGFSFLLPVNEFFSPKCHCWSCLTVCFGEGRSTESLAVQCEATYQRKLRQRRLQQQFREQMEKKQQLPGVTPSTKQGEQCCSKLALCMGTAARHRLPTVQEPGQLHVLCHQHTFEAKGRSIIIYSLSVFQKSQQCQL